MSGPFPTAHFYSHFLSMHASIPTDGPTRSAKKWEEMSLGLFDLSHYLAWGSYLTPTAAPYQCNDIQCNNAQCEKVDDT